MSTTNKEEKSGRCQYGEYIPAERKSAIEKSNSIRAAARTGYVLINLHRC